MSSLPPHAAFELGTFGVHIHLQQAQSVILAILRVYIANRRLKESADQLLIHRERMYALIKSIANLYADSYKPISRAYLPAGVWEMRLKEPTSVQIAWALKTGLINEYEFLVFKKFWSKTQ